MYIDDFRNKVLLRSEQSNDQVAVIEGAVPAHWEGPPPPEALKPYPHGTPVGPPIGKRTNDT